jgi:hypothetical protein
VRSFLFDSVGRTHEEKYQFLGTAITNLVSVASSWSGGSPHRAGLNYADGLPTGLASLSAPVGLSFTHDGIGRLSQVDWDVAPGGSGTNSLAEYGWVGGLRQKRTVHYSVSASSKAESEFSYDAYNRLTKIEDEVWTSSSTHAQKFEYDCDVVYNLLKEMW